MYRIEKTDYGYRLTFTGRIGVTEMRAWLQASMTALAEVNGPFGVLVDMRQLEPLDDDTKAIMVKGQYAYRKSGMQRSAVVVGSPMLLTQFRLLARSSGIHAWEHYIDAGASPDWEAEALRWVRDGIVPEP